MWCPRVGVLARAQVVELRINSNLNNLTIEEVIGKMKRSHLDLIELMEHDLKYSGAPDPQVPTHTIRPSPLVSHPTPHFAPTPSPYRRLMACAEISRSAAAAAHLDQAGGEAQGTDGVQPRR